MARILIIDDDEVVRTYLSDIAVSAGHEAVVAATLGQGLGEAADGDFDLVCLDVTLPDGNGLEFLASFTELPSCPEVIIITGDGDPEGAELAIKNGAWDYIQKSHHSNEISLSLQRCLDYHEKKLRVLPVKRDQIIGSSPKTMQGIQEMARAARSNARILILGETGTGKGIFAKALHENSPRMTKPFVMVDCAALQATLAGSELFGHKKGAFTGAVVSHEGLLQQAHGGTLFLDEVGELDLETQKKFLGVLDEKKCRSLGASQKRQIDFRLVCATNKDLVAMVQQGLFREDLYFRLRGLTISLPALRERRSDLPELIDHFLVRTCRAGGLPLKSLSAELMNQFGTYDWPGNVRELAQVVEALVASAPMDDVLTSWHLPKDLRVLFTRSKVYRAGNPEDPSINSIEPTRTDWKTFRDTSLALAEEAYLRDLRTQCGDSFLKALAISGLSRARLYSLLRKHGLRLQGL